MTVKTILADEVQLLGWGDGRQTGPWIKLRLADPNHLEIFRGLDTATSTKAGHIFDLLLAENDESPQVPIAATAKEPKPKRKFEEMSVGQQAALRCKDDSYAEFLSEFGPITWSNSVARGNKDKPESICKLFLLDWFKVTSRADIEESWWAALEKPYQGWLLAQKYAGVA